MPADLPPKYFSTVPTVSSFANAQPRSITISCGTGSVEISLKDGKVTLTNCTVDDGAEAFWKAVELLAPMKKP